MEKLIELLNEYDPYIQSDGTYTDNFWWYVSKWNSAVFPKEVWIDRIISNEYGFIKWLVDNDKIKLWAYDVEWYHFNIHTYLDLIMLLAIQDEPIEFLISVLK